MQNFLRGSFGIWKRFSPSPYWIGPVSLLKFFRSMRVVAKQKRRSNWRDFNTFCHAFLIFGAILRDNVEEALGTEGWVKNSWKSIVDFLNVALLHCKSV